MSGDKYTQLWEEIWDRVRTYQNIDAEQVNAFFSRLQPQAFSEGFLMLTADTSFIKKWVEANQSHLIKQALEEKYNVPFNVAIEVDSSANYAPIVSNPAQLEANADTALTPTEASTPQTQTLPPQAKEDGVLNTSSPAAVENPLVSEYSFENFVVGSSNQLAYSMALSVAENPGASHLNPLFIYGKSGLGKTHLLRAIQNYVALNYPQMKTVYVDSMELVSNYTDAAIRGGGKEYSNLMQRYTNADIVLIDDVQNLQEPLSL